jgi:peptide/nickel transport system ATP-binding protein/oligopeptide transport system ATP-binding protein
MYLGTIVESAPRAALFERPRHPYTRALLASVPEPNPQRRHALGVLSGDVPSPVNVPTGCRFHPRCAEAMEKCRSVAPVSLEVAPGHSVACHLYGPSESDGGTRRQR